MKRYMVIILSLFLALSALCTACGGSAAGDAEPTELPTVTRPPEGQEVSNILGADENNAPGRMSAGDRLANMSEQQRHVEEMAGEPVSALYEYMGQPKSKEYTTSCMVANAQDGTLYYDDFYVSTLKFSESEEYIMGTGN